MEKQVQLVLVVLAATLLACCSSQSSRTVRPQDVDKILANDRVLNTFIKCLLDKGTCSPDGRELKKTIPNALASNCSICTPNQKVLAERVINHLMAKRPRDWAALSAKYDPKGEYARRASVLLASTTPATATAGKKQPPPPRTAPKPAAPTTPTSSKKA